MKQEFDFTCRDHDGDVQWMLDTVNTDYDRVTLVCYEGMLKWFDLPAECNHIRITLSDKKLKHGYKGRFTRNWPEAMLGQNELYDERHNRWVDETLTIGADALMMRVFQPGMTLRFDYWVAVSTIDGT
jgi:hypothetical protein